MLKCLHNSSIAKTLKCSYNQNRIISKNNLKFLKLYHSTTYGSIFKLWILISKKNT